ncbi:MAG: hypothetical protein Q9221_006104 [Calogaya cf. arnoldii]
MYPVYLSIGLVYLVTFLVASVVRLGPILQLPPNAILSLNTTHSQTSNRMVLPTKFDLGGGLIMDLKWTGNFIDPPDLTGVRKDLVMMAEQIMQESKGPNQFLTTGYYTGKRAVVFFGLVVFDVIKDWEAIVILRSFAPLFDRFRDFRREISAKITTSRGSETYVDLQLARKIWQLPLEWNLFDNTNMTIDCQGQLAEHDRFEETIDSVHYLGNKFLAEGAPNGRISRSTYSHRSVTLQIAGLMTRREMHAAMQETQLLFENGLEPRIFKASIRSGSHLPGSFNLLINDLHGTS